MRLPQREFEFLIVVKSDACGRALVGVQMVGWLWQPTLSHGGGKWWGQMVGTAAMAKAAAVATATDEDAQSKKSFLSVCRENTLSIDG